MDRFWSAPPVSRYVCPTLQPTGNRSLANYSPRTIVAAMAVESVLVYGGLLSGYWVVFAPEFLWKLPPQLWRICSAFLLTNRGLNALFDLYFTWVYSTGLELNSPRFSQPGDFFVYVVFNMAVILVGPFISYPVPLRTTQYLPGQPSPSCDRFLEAWKNTLAACADPSFAKSVKDCTWCRHSGGSLKCFWGASISRSGCGPLHSLEH